MDSRRFPLEEFKALFPNRFESPEEMLRRYQSFLAVFEQLDQTPVPELSARQKADIFRRARQGRRRAPAWTDVWLDLFKRPAVTFAMGIVLGCAVMLTVPNRRPGTVPHETAGPLAVAEPPLTIEHIRRTQVYKGKAVEQMYPEIENPQIVVEKTRESAKPQRVLYGTLDNGEIYVVWNL